MSELYVLDGWRVQVDTDPTTRQRTYEYQQLFTFTGAAQNLDLSIPFPIQFNRATYFSDDATAKSFILQVFSGNPAGSYDALMNVVNNTDQPLSFAGDLTTKYLQQPITIRTAVSASTAGKFLTIKVNVTKL